MPFLRRPPEGEDIHVLQEEVPFLGKEQVESGEIDLAVVHLGGGKVGVQRKDTRERRGEVVEDIEGRFHAGIGSVRLEVPGAGRHDRRHDVEPPALLQPREPGDGAGGAGVDLPVEGHPGDLFLVALDASLDRESQSGLFGSKFNVLKGIAISVAQPSESMLDAACQMPSQSRLTRVAVSNTASVRTPLAFTWN